MGLTVKDRVCETTTTTGTGTLTLAGAVAGYQAWSVIGDTNTAPYFIEAIDADGLPTGAWEAGIGTYTLSGTLARTLVLRSSNSGAAVNLAAGTKRGFCEWPADLMVPGQHFDFRLTTESGVGLSVSDRSTPQSTIYLTPWNGNRLSLWNGSAEAVLCSAEISLALSGLTSGKNYDVFVYPNSGVPTLELSTAWTNDTTRADAVSVFSETGRWTKTSDRTRLLVGTIRTTGTATTEDSSAKRFVWNRYNQRPRFMSIQEGANSWTYSTATWRSLNNSTANRVEFVCGDSIAVDADVKAMATTATANQNVATGVGVDSTSANSAQWFGQTVAQAAFAVMARFRGCVAAGYHFLQALERGAGTDTQTWYGDANLAQLMAGLTATIEA